jgi:hypothetical protein
MTLRLPNLDDRNFEELVAAAQQRIVQTHPDWDDLSPHDPGIVLIEVFAYLTEMMIYRLNQLPDKTYIALLKLLGVSLYPPSSAGAQLVFSRMNEQRARVLIPRGTRVSTNRSGEKPIEFVTMQDATLEPETDEAVVLAHEGTLIEGELIGLGTGQPGLSLQLARPPVVAPLPEQMDLVVAVEALEDDLGERVAALRYNQKTYRVWREVQNFTEAGAQRYAYKVDRLSGTIMFAPAVRMAEDDGLSDAYTALAQIPAKGREIRVWYLHGGGVAGNVPANSLTTLKDAIPGIRVTNPERASGGRDAESLENALLRGPQELHSLQRAVTAQDFENIAQYHAQGIARARAITQAAVWRHGKPGTVEVVILPYIPEQEWADGHLTPELLSEYTRSDTLVSEIQQVLDARRLVGTSCQVKFAHVKPVRVGAQVVVGHEENPDEVKRRVLTRLHQSINPLPTPLNRNGWPFGQALHASHIYDIVLKEPGVRWVSDVRLLVDQAPNGDVQCVEPDPHQPQTWYVCSSDTLFRSLNDGAGWEPLISFPDELVRLARRHTDRPGLLAVVTDPSGEPDASMLYVSTDCGETWLEQRWRFNFHVEDLVWVTRDDSPLLLLATDKGLYELTPGKGGVPEQVKIDSTDPDRGLYAIVAIREARGIDTVAVAMQNTGGIYLSNRAGRSNTFRRISGLEGKDIRKLTIQQLAGSASLWAGTYVSGGDDPGSGCFHWQLRGTEDDPAGWKEFKKGWKGGSCRWLATRGAEVLAATHRDGVVRLNIQSAQPTWRSSSVQSGLPLRDAGRFQLVHCVAVGPEGLIVAGVGGQHDQTGVYTSRDGEQYTESSVSEFRDRITLPETWLFVSGEHEIEVVRESTTTASGGGLQPIP